MERRVGDIETRVRYLESESIAIRRILVGIAPEEIGGVRGDLAALKQKATLILALVLFTFGLKMADVLSLTPKLQQLLK